MLFLWFLTLLVLAPPLPMPVLAGFVGRPVSQLKAFFMIFEMELAFFLYPGRSWSHCTVKEVIPETGRTKSLSEIRPSML